MPATILSIYAPETGKLHAAYRPILVSAFGSTAGVNQVVYCDIYANGVYYKTLSSTSGQPMGGGFALWMFDLQDAAQELVKPVVVPIDWPGSATCQDSMCEIHVKFRGTLTDSSGFIVSDSPSPVQGTIDSPPIAGGGKVSNPFYVINASLKHEDNQDLYTHLALLNEYHGNSANIRVLTLSHRQPYQYYNGPDEYDQIGIMFPYKGNKGTNNYVTLRLQLAWRTKSGAPGSTLATSNDNFTVPMIYSLPCGPAQLKQMPWTTPVPWDDIANYNIGLRTVGSIPQFVWRSPHMVASGCNSQARIRFLNYLGAFDSAGFCDVTTSLKARSKTFERPLIGAPINKIVTGRNRYNVVSSDVMDMITARYAERAMPWLSELVDSPLAYKEWNGGQKQSPNLLPVVIHDSEIIKKKKEGRIIYETKVTAEMANENIRQRN